MSTTREISLVWSLEDVQILRPDLSDDQCGDVLDTVKRYHDCSYGVSWDTISITADELFEKAVSEEI